MLAACQTSPVPSDNADMVDSQKQFLSQAVVKTPDINQADFSDCD